MMKYTILHISDLHKSPSVSYDNLLQSLRRDMISYTEKEGILKPSFIVVSGDIIQGALNEDEIINQYSEAEVFIENLCDLFIEGDRSRIVIVPGNHDINRLRTIASMQESPVQKEQSRDEYLSGSSSVRWNWKDFKFYDIINPDLYNTRFELFIEFYNRFYAGIRQYPKDPVREAYFYKNDKHKVAFACFNSCHQLDHLCYTGNIPEESFISIGGDLIDSYNSGYLNVAVWHHHYYGAPLATNYIDRKFLTYLLEYNVNIGLFGHQHYSQIAEEFSDLQLYEENQLKKLLLISSGTLFGGDRELEVGKHRQYNIIEVERTNGKATISVNIREDRNPYSNNQCPIWHCMALNNHNNKITREINLRKLSDEKLLLEIDRQVRKDGDYIAACENILEIGIDNDRKKSIWLNYLREVKDYEYVYNSLSQVDSVEKAILKIMAAIKLGNPILKKELLEDSFIRTTTDSNIISLINDLK